MKRRIFISFFLFAFVVVQIGCSKTTNSNNTKQTGRYVEQQLKKPELNNGEVFLALLPNQEGNFTYYSFLYAGEKKEIYQYLLVGDIYEKKQITCFDEFLHGEEFEMTLCAGEDGFYYLLMQGSEIMDKGTETERYKGYAHLYRSDKEFTSCEEVTPTTWNQEDSGNEYVNGTHISNIQITNDGVLLYQENSEQEILFYSLIDKKQKQDFSLLSENEYLVKDNTLYYIPQDQLEIRLLDCETKEEQIYQCETIQENTKIQVSSKGTLYLLDGNGIHRIVKDATLWETVVDGSLYSMSVPSLVADSFLLVEGEKEVYYAFYQSKIAVDGNLLACYKFDNNISATTSKELTIYSLWENATLRETISEYQKLHNDVKINYLVAMSEESGATLSEQIRVLNTEILAGKGADIFLLDGLPMDSYINRGVLMDISDILMPMVKDGNLMNNIASNYVQNDEIYGMPMRFYVPVYMTGEDIKEETVSLEQLSSFAASTTKKLFPQTSYKGLLQMFLYTYFEDLFTESGMLKEDELRRFLEQIKVISDSIRVPGQEDVDVKYRFQPIGMQDSTTRINKIFCQNMSQVTSFNVLAVMGYVGDTMDLKNLEAYLSEINGDYFTVNSTYMPNGIVGINSATNEATLAKDFLQYLFSEENQKIHVGDGFPLNIRAFDYWMSGSESDTSTIWMNILDEEGNESIIKADKLKPEKLQEISSIIKQVRIPVSNNAYVMEMIVEEALPYFTGEKDLDIVCQSIINKVNLYLSE